MTEHPHIEWKESWRDDYLRWICGFANAEGGVLVLGKNDKGVAIGIKDPEDLLVSIPNDELSGDLFSQVEKTMELLYTKYLKAYISYDGLQRVETYLFPKLALREAILNAIIHKDYSSGIPIQISVYEDKIVIWNPGVLPERWTLDSLIEKHPSHPFNPLLASAFFRAGYIESWGRGIEKIAHECRQHDLATTLSLSVSGIRYHLEKLRRMGRVHRTGTTKGGHWKVLT